MIPKKLCILFGQSNGLFQGELYLNKESREIFFFMWAKHCFQDLCQSTDKRHTFREKQHHLAPSHMKLNWTGYIWSLIPYSSQLGIISSGWSWKARMHMRGKNMVLWTSYANQIIATKCLRTEALGHNQLSIWSYKQFYLWYSLIVSKFIFMGKMCSEISFVFCVITTIIILQKTLA